MESFGTRVRLRYRWIVKVDYPHCPARRVVVTVDSGSSSIYCCPSTRVCPKWTPGRPSSLSSTGRVIVRFTYDTLKWLLSLKTEVWVEGELFNVRFDRHGGPTRISHLQEYRDPYGPGSVDIPGDQDPKGPWPFVDGWSFTGVEVFEKSFYFLTFLVGRDLPKLVIVPGTQGPREVQLNKYYDTTRGTKINRRTLLRRQSTGRTP